MNLGHVEEIPNDWQTLGSRRERSSAGTGSPAQGVKYIEDNGESEYDEGKRRDCWKGELHGAVESS